jgi:hypothetical protein
MVTVPEASRPSITAFGVVTVIAPDALSDVPAGTPVFDAPGWPTADDGAEAAVTTGPPWAK